MKIGSGSEVLLRRLLIPIYQVVDAARYAGTPPALVSLWRKGRLSPAQREAPLSYLQLVEFAMVAAIRREGISLQRIRKVRELLRQRLGCELPFATWRFFDEGKHILMEHCDELPELRSLVVADKSGRIAWSKIVGERFAQFEYDGDWAIRWHPAGVDSPVVIDPFVAFGAPSAGDIPTWVLRERYGAGESVEFIAEDFNLTV